MGGVILRMRARPAETAAAKESRGHFTGHRRASMGEERLSALAMIHTHYDMAIDLEEVIDIFANLHPRKLELKTSRLE